MPWSSAQMIETPAGSMTLFIRIALPVLNQVPPLARAVTRHHSKGR
jgi:hypothetical protein